MYNKTIIRFGFCDIQNNQGLGKGYQPQPSASADNPYLDLNLIILDITKTSSNNCLLLSTVISDFNSYQNKRPARPCLDHHETDKTSE